MTEKNNLEQHIIEYLKHNPDFFLKHPEILDDITVLHGKEGVPSLVDLKLERQHEKIARQELELEKLKKRAAYNEKIFFSLLPLQEKLSSAKSFEQGMNVLDNWTKNLGLVSANVYIFDDCLELAQAPVYTKINRADFTSFRKEKFGLRRIFLGPLSQKEQHLLFGNVNENLGSVALALLNLKGCKQNHNALLIFVARDTGHFHAGQDHSFLKQFIELFESHLYRWLIKNNG